MLDFLVIATRSGKRGIIEIYPKFIIKKSSDLMIRGGDFYAIWIEERGLWSTDEQDAVDLIDRELDRYAEENCKRFDDNYRVMHMWDAETGMIDTWHKYCQKQMKDQFHMLDEKLIFSNSKTGKKDYASKMLNYPLEQGEANSYDKLMSVLYSPAERHKIEWAIGSVVSGDSKRLQKFMVLYGAAGTGKSTVLNIIQQLFDGYYSVFDAKALGSSSNAFALEAFKTNPLVAIQHDGDLSRIEDNTRLNSLVSHELMTVNEKFKSTYRLYVDSRFQLSGNILNSDYYAHVFSKESSGGSLADTVVFTDIKSIFNQASVLYMYRKGYVEPEAPDTFGGKATARLGEFIDVLYRIAGRPETDNTALPADYENEEFNAAHPYYNAVCWAYQTRLLRQNDPNAEYDDKVDYQTACVLIRRYAIMAGVDTGVNQTQLRQLLRDAPDLGREAAKAMLWCDEKDITTRDSSLDELLASAGTRISRYQMTSFLFYLCTYELDIGS